MHMSSMEVSKSKMRRKIDNLQAGLQSVFILEKVLWCSMLAERLVKYKAEHEASISSIFILWLIIQVLQKWMDAPKQTENGTSFSCHLYRKFS